VAERAGLGDAVWHGGQLCADQLGFAGIAGQ